jgi:hypothetical protein
LCLRNAAQAAAAKHGRLRRLATVGMALAGVLLAWTIFFGAGESVITIMERSERATWHGE